MLLHVEAAILAGMTILLAGPVPLALARARWPQRAPHAALVLWQAVGLGGGLGILTAGLTLAAASVDDRWLPGVLAAIRHPERLDAWGWAGVGITLWIGLWLATAAVTSTARVLRARRAHRQRLDVIAAALVPTLGERPRRAVDIRLLEHPHAVAYCLPGLRPRVVVTSGVLEALVDGEIQAVLAHERAHARGRHDLVIQPFVAWQRTFPFLPPASRAVDAVGELVEMLADDKALQTSDPGALAGAIGNLAGQHFAVTGSETTMDDATLHRRLRTRVARLAGAVTPLPRARRAAVYLGALALVALPPAVLLAS